MKLFNAFWISIFLGLGVWGIPSPGPAQPVSLPFEEREDWMATYFKGQKLGFSYSRLSREGESLVVTSRVYFRLQAEGQDHVTTFSQETRLGSDLSLQHFSLLQEIMGNRQSVEGKVQDGQLLLHVQGTGYDKEQVLPLPPRLASSTSFLLNLHRDGFQVGKKGTLPVLMEPFQLLADLEYEILRRETIPYQDRPVETYVIHTRMYGVESTLWVTEDAVVIRELTPQGFESRKETKQAAQNMGEVLSVSNLITLSIVKPERSISLPEERKQMKLKLSQIRSPDIIPQDHRQKILGSQQAEDGSYSSTLLISTEPTAVAQPTGLPVPSFEDPELLEESAEVQAKHPMIQTLARELVTGTTDAWDAARRINQWVYNNLEKALVDSVSALDALHARKGECQSHTYLFAALARAAGIPTKIVNGLVYSPQYQGFLYHSWPEVYVGEWRALDPTFGQNHVDATHIKLAEGQKAGTIRIMEFIGRVQIELIEN